MFIVLSGLDLKVVALITCLNAAVLCWSGHGEDTIDVRISRDLSAVYYSVLLLLLLLLLSVTCRLRTIWNFSKGTGLP